MMYDTNDRLLQSADKFGAAFNVLGLVTVGPNFKLYGRLEEATNLGVKTYPTASSAYEPKSKVLPEKDGTQTLAAPTFE